MDPIEAIKAKMKENGITRRDLEPAIGTRARVSEVLNKRRALSLQMIRALVRFGFDAETLIKPYKLRR